MLTNLQICGDGLIPSTLVKSLDRVSLSIFIIVNYMLLHIWFWKSDKLFFGGMCVIQKSSCSIHGIKFDSMSSPGVRKLFVTWQYLTGCIEVDVIPGPPTKITLPGLDITQVNRCNAYMLFTLGYDVTSAIFITW